MISINRPLKILMILHMPWSRNLGGSRVQLELADEFRAMGHEVAKFDYNDAYDNTTKNSRLKHLFRPIFAHRARAFIRANAKKFDIIDAHQGKVPFSKDELNFSGLLVSRSVGLRAFYDQFSKFARTQWSHEINNVSLSNILQSCRDKIEKPDYFRSFQVCDLINLPNSDELEYVRDVMGFGDKSIVMPFGLSLERFETLSKFGYLDINRFHKKTVCFIGTWGKRKGSEDWPEIIRLTLSEVPEAKFLLLGTGVSKHDILRNLDIANYNAISVVPNFETEKLPELLTEASLGAFPSYIEGFGIAVLEKLAAGIPTVAYDTPGPRSMLHNIGESLLIPKGNSKKFANQLIKLLKTDEAYYEFLSNKCRILARNYLWRDIAKDTITAYTQKLEVIQKQRSINL